MGTLQRHALARNCARTVPSGRSGVRKEPYGESDTDHQQQELFVVVAARLAADQILWAGVWSLRGWLLTKFSGLEFDEIITAPDDASARAEILLLSSSILVPCLRHEGATVWDTLAIAEYLDEIMPDAGLLPADRI